MTNVQVMVDMETYSTAKTAAIASIGAVKFEEGKILDKFYVNIDPRSCKEAGLHFSEQTLQWWSEQPKEVRDALKVDQKSLTEALEMFKEWFGPKSLPTWGNGVSFDNVILENAYRTLNMTPPWKYAHERCFRTVCAIFGVSHTNNRVGSLHNALDDAESQVLTLQSLFKGK